MLKKTGLLLLALIIISCTKEQLTPPREQSKIITGQILGYDGKPIVISHVHATIYGDKLKKLSIPTDKNGNFTLEYKKSDLKLSLAFSGVNHKERKFDLYTLELPNITDLTVKLRPNTFQPQEEGIKVIGNFNDFSFSKNTIPMELDDEGKYFAIVPNNSDTLFYQIIGALPSRSINGTMSHGYVYDGGGDYRSYIVSKDSAIKIVFDPDKLPSGDFKSEITSSTEAINQLLEFRKYENKILKDAYSFYQKTQSISEYFGIIGDSLIAYYKNHKNSLFPSVKMNLVHAILERTFGYNTPDEILYYYMDNIKPTSTLQKEFHDYTINGLIRLKNEKADKYIVELYENNPDEKIRARVLSNLVQYYHYKKDEKNKIKYYNLLLEKYPESTTTKNTIKRFAPDKKMKVGNMLPEFELKNLDNENEIINNEYLKGKYWLIDVWATWCAPCLEEMPYLHEAYKKFASDKFQIFSISFDAKPDDVKKFRKGKWKMPWLNAFSEGAFDSQIGKKFEVSGIPNPILIDPEGKIIELEGLRGEFLIQTLKKYLK